MACCAKAAGCPMHKGDSQGSSADRVLTQIDADNCCAASERQNSSPSTPTVVGAISFAVLGPGIVLPVSVPSRVLSDDWRTFSPLPTTAVPKHVLLSVFLV